MTDGEFGMSLDVFLKPIRRAPKLLFTLDESKNQVLTIRSSYRYHAVVQRRFNGGTAGSLEATARYPLTRHFGHLLISARNRMDFRIIDGAYSLAIPEQACRPRARVLGRARARQSLFAIRGVLRQPLTTHSSKAELMVGRVVSDQEVFRTGRGKLDHQLDTGTRPNRADRARSAWSRTFYF